MGLKKISALMLTYNRLNLIEDSINCFLSQIYDNKELVIVNSGGTAYFTQVQAIINTFNVNNIKHIYVNKDDKKIGDLRNIAIQNASGDYLCTWDDDDIFSRQRLKAQAHFMRNFDYCMLSNFLLSIQDSMYSVEYSKGFEPSLMFKKELNISYPSLSIGEDSYFISELEKKYKGIVIDNDKNDYIYRCSNDNISGYEHFKLILKNHKSKKI